MPSPRTHKKSRPGFRGGFFCAFGEQLVGPLFVSPGRGGVQFPGLAVALGGLFERQRGFAAERQGFRGAVAPAFEQEIGVTNPFVGPDHRGPGAADRLQVEFADAVERVVVDRQASGCRGGEFVVAGFAFGRGERDKRILLCHGN